MICNSNYLYFHPSSLVGCDEERIARGVAIIENIIKNCLTVSLFTNPQIVNNNGLSIEPYSSGPNIPITAAEVDDAVAAHAVSVPLFNPRSNPSNDRTDTRTNIDYQLKIPYGIREKENALPNLSYFNDIPRTHRLTIKKRILL